MHDGVITVTATTTDLAGNQSTGVPGSTSFTLDTVAIATYSRQALTLDAWKNQSASMAGIAGTSYGANMTLEAWINPDLGQIPDGKYMPIFDLNSAENAANNNIFLGINKQGKLYFSAYSGATRLGTATTNNAKLIASNMWQHVAVTVDSAGIIKMYLNGELISNIVGGTISVNGAGATATTIPSVARSIANIGKSTNPSEGFSNSATDRNNYYNGAISDVRIYTEARNAAVILSDSGGAVSSTAPNLIAYYPFVNDATSGKSGGTDASLSNIANPAYPAAYPLTYSLALSDDTAVLGTKNHDFITKTPTQTINGTLTEPWVVDNQFFIEGLDNNKTAAISDGGYTLSVTPNSSTFSITGAKLKTGTNDLKIRVVDAAGNIGPTLIQIYTLDTVAPTTALIPATLALSADTGPTGNNSDFITNTANQTISGTLNPPLASGESVWVSVDRGNTWNQATSSIGSAAWSLEATLLPPPAIESQAIMVKVTDTAGNDGPIGSKSYRLDTTAPTAAPLQHTPSPQVLALDSSKKQYANLPSTAVAVSGSMTLEAWVYANGDPSGQYLFDFATSASSDANRILLRVLNSNQPNSQPNSQFLALQIYNSNGASSSVVNSNTPLPLYAWTHIAVTVSEATTTILGSAAKYKIYINGVQVGANEYAGIPVPTANRTLNAIGRTFNNNNTSTYFNGLIRDVRIFDTERTATEIVSDQTSAVPSTVTGAYMFNGTVASGKSGATANDNAALASDLLPTPALPSYTQTLKFSADTGSSDSDLITKTAAQTITIPLLGTVAADESVFGSVDNGKPGTWVDIKSVGGSVTGSLATWPTTLLSGTHAILLKVLDTAGNNGPISTQTYTLDDTPPPNRVDTRKALALDASKQQQAKLPIANTSPSYGRDMTMEAWVYANGAQLENAHIFNLSTSSNTHTMSVSFAGDTLVFAVAVEVQVGTVHATEYIWAPGVITANTWNHVAISINNASASIYVNGVVPTDLYLINSIFTPASLATAY